MEVYTGFKRISWSKKQRQKKTFSRRRKSSRNSIFSIYKRVFRLKPSKNKSEIYTCLGLLLVILITAFLNYTSPKFTDYHNNRSAKLQKLKDRADKYAFNFLMRSGKNRLKANNLVGALSEFKLAKAIYPNDEMVNQLLVETLARLCNNGNSYCYELDGVLSMSL